MKVSSIGKKEHQNHTQKKSDRTWSVKSIPWNRRSLCGCCRTFVLLVVSGVILPSLAWESEKGVVLYVLLVVSCLLFLDGLVLNFVCQFVFIRQRPEVALWKLPKFSSFLHNLLIIFLIPIKSGVIIILSSDSFSMDCVSGGGGNNSHHHHQSKDCIWSSYTWVSFSGPLTWFTCFSPLQQDLQQVSLKQHVLQGM